MWKNSAASGKAQFQKGYITYRGTELRFLTETMQVISQWSISFKNSKKNIVNLESYIQQKFISKWTWNKNIFGQSEKTHRQEIHAITYGKGNQTEGYRKLKYESEEHWKW